MIKEKQGVTIDPDLNLTEFLQLDLSRVHQAFRINCEKFESFQHATADNKDDILYLSFINPGRGNDVNEYFMDALGCTAGTSSQKATKSVLKGCRKFLKDNQFPQIKIQSIEQKLISFLIERAQTGTPVKLAQVGEVVRAFFEDTEDATVQEQVDELLNLLNGEEFMVSQEFRANKSVSNKAAKIFGKTPHYNIELEKSSIGVTDNFAVQYDKENNCLILNDIPEQTIQDINELLSDEKS